MTELENLQPADAVTTTEVEAPVAESVVEEITQEKTEESIEIDFKPEEFVNNLGYMGKGMFGIFVVIGIIIASVYALAKIGNKGDKQ